MAKPKKASKTPDPAEALAKLEQPRVQWKTILQIGLAFIVLWVTSAMLVPYVGYWGLGVVGVLTLVAIGFGIYIWRMTRRSQAIVDIMKQATDEKGREEAIGRLAEGGSKDALKALAHAQLVAQSDPQQAMSILENIDLKKAPAVVQDDVRAQRALLYLRGNRVREARELADDIRMDRQPNAKSKAMYAAVIAESFSRTGRGEEARKLVETYPADEPEYGDVRPLLLRAQVYTYYALKKRGLARKAMERMAEIDPNMLGAFVQKGTQPELAKMARQVLAGAGFAPKMKVKRAR